MSLTMNGRLGNWKGFIAAYLGGIWHSLELSLINGDFVRVAKDGRDFLQRNPFGVRVDEKQDAGANATETDED